MQISSFPSTAYWGRHPFPIVYSYCLCQPLVHPYMDLFLGYQFCSIGLYLFLWQYNTFFLITIVCNLIWNQKMWYFFVLPQDFYNYSWSFVFPYESSMFFLYFCENIIGILIDFIKSIDCFEEYGNFDNTNSPNHEHRIALHYLCFLPFLSLMFIVLSAHIFHLLD